MVVLNNILLIGVIWKEWKGKINILKIYLLFYIEWKC